MKLSSWLEKETIISKPILNNIQQSKQPLLFLLSFFSFWFLVLCFGFYRPNFHPHNNPHHLQNYYYNPAIHQKLETSPPTKTKCKNGRISVYLYDLPPEFNLGLLDDCAHLNFHTNMCPHIANDGLGQPISYPGGSSSSAVWSATHQFVAELLFHARLKNHPCRTLDPTRANLYYVPFYGGLHASSKFREKNHTARDEVDLRLIDFLQSQPSWKKNQGRDHFLTLGRIARDFTRTDGALNRNDYGANRFLHLPPVRNMSVLIIERDPSGGSNSNQQHGIPYPSYFHPSTSHQMLSWQNQMRKSDRPYLFSFIGAPRNKGALRNEMIKQCNETERCELMLCARGARALPGKCGDPREVIGVMRRSQFCLQAPGDSFTRRSTFDSVVAGCIPVFFSPHTAYTQYQWYFPVDASEYSVYIDAKKVKGGNKRWIEEELSKIPVERVERMRNTVINLMPRVTYAHPNASDAGFEDAVDVALDALANKLIN